VALDAFTGSVVWQDSFPAVAFNGGVTLTPDVGRVGGGDSPALLVSTNGDFLTALDPQTGQTLWFTNPGGLATQASVDGGLAYVVVNGDEVRALDLHNAGAVVWSATIAPSCNNCSVTSVSAAGSVVIAGASTGGTSNPYAAFNATTGKLIWRVNVDTGSPFSVFPAAVGLDRAFVVGVDGVHALSLSSGAQIWKSKPFNMPPSGPPTVANGVVYMTDDSSLVTLRASDGVEISFVSPQNAGQNFENEVVVSDGRLFLSSGRAGLQVYGP
jgi:outer membrane protein assembly factor BamB